MNASNQSHIDAGYSALKTANWLEARKSFEIALQDSQAPEAYDGLGIACWWLNDIRAAHHYRSLAFNGFKSSNQLQEAVLIACWLAREQVFLYSNVSAMQGWFARAESLLQTLPPSPEHAWYRLLKSSMLDSPPDLEKTATQSLQIARDSHDTRLEAISMAFYGLAMVVQSNVLEGMRYLDEAMTMSTSGEVRDFMVISEIFCVMLSACEAAGDLIRSEQWCQKAWDFAEQNRCPFLSAYCRTTYGSILTSMGRWQDAELVLKEALGKFEQGHQGLRVHALIRLADLRIQQGRLEEAELMLAGLEDQSSAIIPLARLHLAKQETSLAKAILSQALPPSPPYTLHHLAVVVLLVDVLLSLKDFSLAQELANQLLQLANRTESKALLAQAELTSGRVYLQRGELELAKSAFSSALEHQQQFEQSLLAGQIRLAMAETLQASDLAGAIVWAKAALATFERIGSVQDAAYASNFLRQLGVGAGSGPRLQKTLTKREFEIAELLAHGLSNRDISERLVISAKTVEHHVSSILQKLNLRNRSELTAFVVSGKLGKEAAE